MTFAYLIRGCYRILLGKLLDSSGIYLCINEEHPF